MPYCPACFDDGVPEDEMMVLPGCGHSLCKDCWKGLVSAALNKTDDVDPNVPEDVLPCPGLVGSARCPHFVEIETIFILLGTQPPPEFKKRVEQKQQHTAAVKAKKISLSPELVALYQSIEKKHQRVRAIARKAHALHTNPSPDAPPLEIPPLEELNYVDEHGRTLLHWAATYRTFGVIDFLYSNYANQLDVNVVDNFGRTPLHYATRGGSTVISQKLTSVGADPSRVDNDGMTPLEYANLLPVNESSINIIRLLVGALASLQAPIPVSILFDAATRNRSTTISAIIEASPGIDVNHTDASGRTPLHYASGSFATDSVRVLLNSHALCDIPDHQGFTPLICAARQGCGLIVTLLLTAGANPGHRDHNGYSPLMWAAQNGHTHIVTNLLDRGAHGGVDDLYHALFKARAQQATECAGLLRIAMEINIGPPSLQTIVEENIHRKNIPVGDLSQTRPQAYRHLLIHGPSHPSILQTLN